MWTASAHIITAVIGSGVLSLAWAVAQLGWVAGPTVLLSFAFVTYFTSLLLSSCYRTGDPISGQRNYTYMHAVGANLGRFLNLVCGAVMNENDVFSLSNLRRSSGEGVWDDSVHEFRWNGDWLHHCCIYKHDVSSV